MLPRIICAPIASTSALVIALTAPNAADACSALGAGVAAADQHYQDHRAGRGGGVHREGVEISDHRRLAANLFDSRASPASVSESQLPMTQGKVRRLLNGEIISVIRL